MSFFKELKRRNVFRIAIGYVITAWLLLQVVDLVLENINTPDWVMQVFMLALAIGFPLAVFFAWAFEMTPEGVKRESEVDRSKSIAPQTGRKMDRSIIVVLVLALAYFAYDKFSTPESGELTQPTPQTDLAIEDTEPPVISPAPAPDKKSIAVLPLVNRSINAEDAFFAEGLHDELLTQLSRISALRVISRTSVMGYTGTTKRMTDIGKELGVATLLEGGVQRSGNRVRINVQLIDAASDEHLWAEVYDRELTVDNLFDIQSDITRAIANALQAVLTGEEQQKIDQKLTDNVEAYAYYLRGKATSKGYGRLVPEIDTSIATFQAAIDLDPGFAAAYAALSTDWVERYWISDRLGDELQHSLDALQHAQALAPNSVETLTAAGYYHYWGYLDYVPAIDAFKQALELEPGNLRALRGQSFALRRMGRYEESIANMEKILSLDPLDAGMPGDLGYTLLRAGQVEKAGVMINRAFTMDPDGRTIRSTLAEYYLIMGDLESAKQAFGPIKSIPGFYQDTRLLIARAHDETDVVDQVLEAYQETNAQAIGSTFSHALVLRDRGEQNKLNTLVTQMQADMQMAQREQPGKEATLLGLISLYGLNQDKIRLKEAVKSYYASVKPDALRLVENRTIPISYAVAGDTEALLAYLEDIVETFGPWEFYYFTIDPSFNNMRDLPRFQALEIQYRQWLEQLP